MKAVMYPAGTVIPEAESIVTKKQTNTSRRETFTPSYLHDIIQIRNSISPGWLSKVFLYKRTQKQKRRRQLL